MIKLQHFNGLHWIDKGLFKSETLAWKSICGALFDYRTIDKNGNVLTDKSRNKNERVEQNERFFNNQTESYIPNQNTSTEFVFENFFDNNDSSVDWSSSSDNSSTFDGFGGGDFGGGGSSDSW